MDFPSSFVKKKSITVVFLLAVMLVFLIPVAWGGEGRDFEPNPLFDYYQPPNRFVEGISNRKPTSLYSVGFWDVVGIAIASDSEEVSKDLKYATKVKTMQEWYGRIKYTQQRNYDTLSKEIMI